MARTNPKHKTRRDNELYAYLPLEESAFDSERGVAKVTVIRPGFNTSKSRYYPAETLIRDFGIFEGAKMFINHPTNREENERPEGDLSRWVATLRNVSAMADGIVVGESYIHDNTWRSTMANLAEQGNLSQLGVSIRGIGDVSEATIEGIETVNVDRLVEGRSVDYVTEAGAGGGVQLYEAERKREEIRMEELQEQLDKVQADLAAAQETITALEGQLAEAQADTVKAEERAELEKVVAESELPEKVIDKVRKVFESSGLDSAKSELEFLAEHIKPAKAEPAGEIDESAHVEDLGGAGDGDETSDNDAAAIMESVFIAQGVSAEEAKRRAEFYR